ncbi:hypothetical protein HZH68_008092 [Vespula germanica]|uniref:Uncharacterized protein n=1 Tax=Vespula germanica TaxID=30212 RepID=A0A834N8B3_VESGE|nr:hypothetical protein HZH68_008092 [Vespula germanica]
MIQSRNEHDEKKEHVRPLWTRFLLVLCLTVSNTASWSSSSRVTEEPAIPEIVPGGRIPSWSLDKEVESDLVRLKIDFKSKIKTSLVTKSSASKEISLTV